MKPILKVYLTSLLKRVLKLFLIIKIINKNQYFALAKQLIKLGEVTVKPKNFGGIEMLVSATDIGVGHSLILRKSYEGSEVAFFKKNIKKNDIFVDVGAAGGYFSLLAAKLVGGKGTVYSFEPETYNYSLLVKNVQKNRLKNVICVNKAIGDRAGFLKLYRDFATFNLGDHNSVKSESREIKKVEMTSLDDFLKKERKIDIVKIDVQGSEQLVLLGMERIIRKNPKIKILMEVCPSLIEKSGLSLQSLLKVIREYNFSIYELKQNGDYIKTTGKDILQNRQNITYINVVLKR